MAQCSGRHISEMQLFHELKQRFPNIPDRLVTHCIKQTRGDKAACTCILEAETLLSSYRMANRPRSLSLEEEDEDEDVEAVVGLSAKASANASDAEDTQSAPATPSAPRKPPAARATLTPPPVKPKRLPTPRTALLPQPKHAIRASHLLIQDQLARKKNLEMELEKDKAKLNEMQKRAKELEEDLKALSRVERLRDEIVALRSKCDILAQEVIRKNNGVPLGETNEEYYRRPAVPVRENPLSSHNVLRNEVGARGGLDVEEGSGAEWKCSLCTKRNQPRTDQCDVCYMPRLIDRGETQNIHIHVTHHNFPSCKVVHSWVI